MTTRLTLAFAAALVALGSFAEPAAAQIKVDPDLPAYKKTIGVAGKITSVGSDTMNSLMQKWAEGFRRHYSAVRIDIQGQGSSTAMPALIAGAATFGPLSRDAKGSEIEQFEKKFGYKPVLLPTSIDLLGVYVHRDNPIESLTMPQVDAIFSRTRKLGGSEQITNWGQLGLGGEYNAARIDLFGRNAASGTYGYFKDVAMGNGDYLETVNEQAGSATVVQSVGENKYAIGYSGIGYMTAAVKAVPLAPDANSKPVTPSPANAYNGEYPLARYLYLAVNYKPNTRIDPLRAEFIKFIFSREGQQIVIDDGYYPVTAETAKEVLKSLNLAK